MIILMIITFVLIANIKVFYFLLRDTAEEVLEKTFIGLILLLISLCILSLFDISFSDAMTEMQGIIINFILFFKSPIFLGIIIFMIISIGVFLLITKIEKKINKKKQANNNWKVNDEGGETRYW